MKGKTIIFFIILLMISAIVIFDLSIRQSNVSASVIPEESSDAIPTTMLESEVFNLQDLAIDFSKLQSIESEKTLAEYYENRAYDGAPPKIPHPVLSEKGIGGKTCLQCHSTGGYVDRFKAFAPITPHPDFLNCNQCHVPKKTDQLFVSSQFKRPTPKRIGSGVLDGSPPPIPHDFQVRGSCLSCHGAPSVAKEIRVSHPERVNCLQCHAPTNSRQITWERKSTEEEGGTE
ncbi:MAG: multiheme c-type cytochrome [Ekhidna sp.]